MAVAPVWWVRQTPWEHQGQFNTVQQSTCPNKGSATLGMGNKDELLNIVIEGNQCQIKTLDKLKMCALLWV